MLTLFLLVLVLFAVVAVLLSAWTLWFQAYIYSEPTTGIAWRGPAAGAAVTAFLIVWVVLDYRTPGGWRTIFDSTSSTESKPFPELRVPKPGGGYSTYKLSPTGRLDYRLDGKPPPAGKQMPSRPAEIVAVAPGGEESVFKPDRDQKGNFKVPTTSTWFGKAQTAPLRYTDPKGQVMLETSIGQVSTFHTGWVIGTFILNLLFLGVWFLSLWLLLNFQWPHALGQAVVFWGVMLLFVMPPVLTRAETVAKERAAARARAG